MIRFVTIKNNEPAPAQDMASALLGIAGVTVTEVEEEADGRLSVWAMVTRTCRLPWLRCYFGTRARVGGDEAAGCQVRRAGHRPLLGQAQAGMRGGELPGCSQNEQVTELTTLAATMSRWEDEIATAVITGVTNARSESLNRIAKLEARKAYGFRNPANQRRRVHITRRWWWQGGGGG
jgi:hypothetical protein